MQSALSAFPVRTNIRTDASSLMYYSMILLAMSIPLSEFGMSVSQFLMLIFWAHEGADFKQKAHHTFLKKQNPVEVYFRVVGYNLAGKFRRLFNNPAVLVVISLYLIHVAGLIYTTDLPYALKDLRIKLPLLSLPVIIATSSALSIKRFNRLLFFFCLAVFSGSIASIYVLFTRHVSDPRELSIFISHIRFGLTICFSIFILAYFVYKKDFPQRIINILIIISILWFTFFLIILESVTGLVITGLLVFIFTLIAAYRIRPIFIRALIMAGVLLSPVLAANFVRNQVRQFSKTEPVDFKKLDRYTRFGTPYVHDTCSFGIEKGKYIGLYIAPIELRQEWSKRSKLRYDGPDNKGQELRYTIIRYLNSKNLRKDADGIRSLTDKEIKHIENGVADAAYLENLSISSRMDQMIMGYTNYLKHGDPNASSMMQRVEYWKTSAYIIRHHWLTGVGTGDLNLAFSNAYQKMGSKLHDAFRNRSHNQFLAIFVAFGIFGLIWFLFSLFYPPFITGRHTDYHYLIFFIIIFLSMLTEDTLETQAGATFFAFFNALLLFGRKRENNHVG